MGGRLDCVCVAVRVRLGVCGCDCVGESGCVWLVLSVMWAEMEIFMHVSHVYM